ncbi:fumarylacetoacetate hydrolase family protein [Alicyclobacillus shizuokensis]|uniref:fumarylacetoacetate hydrolase family protein n=1 Tax=Alicyclobacillus shizuokensis TaxID=392014 RepID=UPI000834311D|nr:fumarylacetoacetate hydrolase family protein [Alicyclobacillus shizuokensis]
MIRTLRYLDPSDGRVQLGLLEGDDVYSITRQIPEWTCPIDMWRVLTVLGVPLASAVQRLLQGPALSFIDLERGGRLLPPVACPEVWASGVTYERSRDARNAETQLQDSVYDRVYIAERPELFFKSTYRRLVAPEQPLSLRSDSHWMVPEPELSVVVGERGEVIGWTIGNDLSSRDIEGENPLYLPQAKVFANSCAFGPVLLWNTGSERPHDWRVRMTIHRDGASVFSGDIAVNQLHRGVDELIAYLLRDNPILDGTVLMTGTGIVPPDEFTLAPGDVVEISVDEIGTLRNPVNGPTQRASAEPSLTARRDR